MPNKSENLMNSEHKSNSKQYQNGHGETFKNSKKNERLDYESNGIKTTIRIKEVK